MPFPNSVFLRIALSTIALSTHLFFAVSLPFISAAEPLELVRQQFEIYTRHTGEIELLYSEDSGKIDGVLNRTEKKRQDIRKALEAAVGKQQSAKGAAEPFRLYAAAENAAAKRAVQLGKPDDAVAALRAIYRLTDHLSASAYLEDLLAAAQIRLRTFDTVQMLCLSPCCRHNDHETLYEIFDAQLTRRPKDKAVWTQYQKEGEALYEQKMRDGRKRLAETLKPDKEKFQRLMQAVIDSCELPFYQRQHVMRTMEEELRKRRQEAGQAGAADLLLQKVPEGMRLFAQDRTANEMLYLALAVSVKGERQPKGKNFLTGSEYKVLLIPDGIMVTYEGNVKPFYLPYRGELKFMVF